MTTIGDDMHAASARLAREHTEAIAVATDAALESGQIQYVRCAIGDMCLDVAAIVPDGQGGAHVYHMGEADRRSLDHEIARIARMRIPASLSSDMVRRARIVWACVSQLGATTGDPRCGLCGFLLVDHPRRA